MLRHRRPRLSAVPECTLCEHRWRTEAVAAARATSQDDKVSVVLMLTVLKSLLGFAAQSEPRALTQTACLRGRLNGLVVLMSDL